MNNLPQTSPLSQILAMIQQSHGNTGGGAPQMPNNNVQPQQPAPYAGQGTNGGAGNPGGLSIPGMINAASNYTSLPWQNPLQNAAGFGSAVLQGGGSALGSSALSALVGMLL